jgi:thiol-disulfide isomerase/thioredoxin
MNTPWNRRRWVTLGVAAAAGTVGVGVGVGWKSRLQAPGEAGAAGVGAGTAAGAANDTDALARFWRTPWTSPLGEKLAMSRFQGKALLVNFWATWCPPCIEELPLIDAFFLENLSKNWQVIGLAVDQTPAVQRFLSQHPLKFPIAMAGLEGIELSRALGNLTGALPYSVVFDASGAIALRQMGKLSQTQLTNLGNTIK